MNQELQVYQKVNKSMLKNFETLAGFYEENKLFVSIYNYEPSTNLEDLSGAVLKCPEITKYFMFECCKVLAEMRRMRIIHRDFRVINNLSLSS